MDAALRHPVMRIMAAVLFFAVLSFAVMMALEVGAWRTLSGCIGVLIDIAIAVPIGVELGSVALTGRSRARWFLCLMKTWSPRKPSE